MNRTELWDLIRNGEDSAVEFKRDGIENHELAKELVAFLNLQGGVLLLGVEDDGAISGVSRAGVEEWVTELCRTKIEPQVIPFLSWVRDASPGKDLLAIRVPQGPDKPYARVHRTRRTYFIRVGSTCREASREELERMYQAAGRLHYGLKPVPGASLDALDMRRLSNYLNHVLGGPAPAADDRDGWERLLTNLEMMTNSAGQRVATVNGVLLFARQPNRYLPQAGVRAVCYPGVEAEYATRADEDLRGPLTPLRAADGSLVEAGLVEQASDFVRRNTRPTSRLEGARRVDRWEYPPEVIRETIVNALVHRDYTITGADITLTIYADRLEVRSPGWLPNTLTIEAMRAGVRYARNQTLVNVMRDYDYVDARGMGVRSKIVPGMQRHNGTEPDLIEEHQGFTVRLWNSPKGD